MTDVRTLLTHATDEPPAADPVAAVRGTIRRRRARRRMAAGTAALAVVVAGGGALATRTDEPSQEVRPVSGAAPTSLPSGGSERATRPPDNGVDEPNPGLIALGELVTANSDVFVGMHVDDGGVVVVAFGPEADPAQWAERLRAAAGRQAWRTTRCGHSRAELSRVQRSLEGFAWPSGRPAYGAYVDAETCSVHVTTGPLPAADAAALRAEFGDRVTLDTSGAPSRR